MIGDPSASHAEMKLDMNFPTGAPEISLPDDVVTGRIRDQAVQLHSRWSARLRTMYYPRWTYVSFADQALLPEPAGGKGSLAEQKRAAPCGKPPLAAR